VRTALHPPPTLTSHRDTVEEVQAGYCVYDPKRDLFASSTAPDDLGITLIRGYRLTWCGCRGDMRIWGAAHEARAVAVAVGCVVVTVPRSNGYSRVWDTVEERP
jgi:hypothetical protein